MTIKLDDLPAAVRRYLSTPVAERARIVDDVFTAGAVVHDEGNTYRGTDAIRQWTAALAEAFDFDGELEKVVREGNRISADVMYTGDFPGSPVRVTSHFAVENDLISEIDNRA